MPPKTEKIIVVLEPLSKPDIDRNKQTFPKFPELYLELLENPNRVKPEFRGKPYAHKYSTRSLEILTDESLMSNKPKSALRKITTPSTTTSSSKNSFLFQRSEPLDSSTDSEDDAISSAIYDQNKKKFLRAQEQKKRETTPKHLPSLVELKKQNATDIKDYIPYTREDVEDEEDKKRELLFKFQRLQKMYPNSNTESYQHFNIRSNYSEMQGVYEYAIKSLTIESNAEKYKSYLIAGFMGIELVSGKLGYDMEGYTQQQMLIMKNYETLLVELGEKSYAPDLSKWSVEVRLAIMVLFQTTIFVVSKTIAKKTNVNLLNIYNKVSGDIQKIPKKTHDVSGVASSVEGSPTNINKGMQTPNRARFSTSRMSGPKTPN